jgi:shikimate dehydrogenase
MGIPYAEVIGDPIAHSKSPIIHKFWLDKLGLEGHYRATKVSSGEFKAYLELRRKDPDWRGCNVTMPLKKEIGPYLDVIDPSSEWAGSSNCVFWDGGDLTGANTDTSGVALALEDVLLPHQVAVMIGAGAAAQTAASILKWEEVAELRVIARNLERVTEVLDSVRLVGRFYTTDEAEAACSGAMVVMNASPLGMSGFDPMPQAVIDAVRHTRIDATIFDMVYTPNPTDLLLRAKQFGRRTVDGLTMLIGQARDSFIHFFNAAPPLDDESDSQLRKLLTS